MATNQIIDRLQFHIRDTSPTQAMLNAQVAFRIKNRMDNTLIQTRKASEGRINIPTSVYTTGIAAAPVTPPSP